MPGPLVIANPAAAGGRAARLEPWLASQARRDGAEVAWTNAPGHATELARRAVVDGRPRVLAVGGDGTVQEVVNGLLDADAEPTPLVGLVQVGSGNDLSRSLGLPHAREEAWRVAIGGQGAPLDVGHAVNGDGQGRYFVSVGGVGFDAQVAATMAGHRSWRRGAIGYLLATLDELRRFRNRRVRLSLDGVPAVERTVLMVAVANGPYYGGGMQICPEARTDDGWLDLCVVGDVSRLTALGQLPRIYRGAHVRHPAVSMHRARRLRVEGDGDTRIHLDGEPFGSLPLEVRVVAAALRVAVA